MGVVKREELRRRAMRAQCIKAYALLDLPDRDDERLRQAGIDALCAVGMMLWRSMERQTKPRRRH